MRRCIMFILLTINNVINKVSSFTQICVVEKVTNTKELYYNICSMKIIYLKKGHKKVSTFPKYLYYLPDLVV